MQLTVTFDVESNHFPDIEFSEFRYNLNASNFGKTDSQDMKSQ